MEKERTHNIGTIAVKVKDQTTGQIIFTKTDASSDTQGKIFLNDAVFSAATPGAHYTIGVKPDAFFRRVKSDSDIAASLGGACIVIPTALFGDLNADGQMGIPDLVNAIQHYRAITIHPTLDQLFGAGNFRISHLVWMIKQFVTQVADDVGL